MPPLDRLDVSPFGYLLVAALLALLLLLSAGTLLGYEAAWRLWRHRRHHSAPDVAAGRVAR